MTSRERVFRALSHKQPDRCPVDFWAEPSALKTLMNHFGAKTEQELYDYLDVDLQFVFPDSTLPPPEILEDGTWYAHDGAHMRLVKNEFTEYAEYISRPLAFVEEVEDFEQYDKWPNANDYDWEHYSDKIGDLHEKRVIKLHTGGFYETAWMMRGQEQFLIDMALNPEIAHYIMEKICNFWCEFIKKAMEHAQDKIDIVYTYDDIATQRTLIMSPKMLEEFVYPYHRRVNALIKSYGKKILYHSCGSIITQIDNLKKLPIDVLNPLQPLAVGMDFQYIKDTWGQELCFHGGMDVQHTLPNGKVEEVREAVKRAISILGKDGGYIMTSAHYIQNDTPIENILAMYDTSIR